MINRCFDCNRYVSLEVESCGVDVKLDSGVVTGEVRLLLVCADCGAPLGEHKITIECRTTDFAGA